MSFAPQPVVEDNRSVLGSRLHQMLAQQFTPVEANSGDPRASRLAPRA